MKIATIFALFLFAGLVIGCLAEAGDNPKSARVLIRPSRGYNKAERRLRYDENMALQILESALKGKPKAYYGRTPQLIVDGTYLFSVPEKASIRLEGFYVDGNTGRVVYKKSNLTIVGESEIPQGAYSSEEEVAPGDK